MRRHSYFSLEEANGLIPTLEYYCRQLAILHTELASLQYHLQRHGAKVAVRGVTLPRSAPKEVRGWRARYYERCREFDALLEELAGTGVEIIDTTLGLVNIYTWWDGEEVVLSWQYGEPSVQFWFDPGESASARRPIRQLFHDAPTGRAQWH